MCDGYRFWALFYMFFSHICQLIIYSCMELELRLLLEFYYALPYFIPKQWKVVLVTSFVTVYAWTLKSNCSSCLWAIMPVYLLHVAERVPDMKHRTFCVRLLLFLMFSLRNRSCNKLHKCKWLITLWPWFVLQCVVPLSEYWNF